MLDVAVANSVRFDLHIINVTVLNTIADSMFVDLLVIIAFAQCNIQLTI
jgi:hypothetical protein